MYANLSISEKSPLFKVVSYACTYLICLYIRPVKETIGLSNGQVFLNQCSTEPLGFCEPASEVRQRSSDIDTYSGSLSLSKRKHVLLLHPKLADVLNISLVPWIQQPLISNGLCAFDISHLISFAVVFSARPIGASIPLRH